MSFLARLRTEEPFDTWLGMERAAEERYWDGLYLAVSNEPRNTGAIYLFGYVAEMLVKAAYFRVTGVLETRKLEEPLWAARKHGSWLGGNLHSLSSWVHLLLEERRFRGQDTSPTVAALIEYHLLTVDSNWNETLRYKHSHAAEAEVAEVFRSIEWLHDNYQFLWS